MFLFLMASCTEKIDFSPYHQRKIVINCVLTPESIQKLSLTYSNVAGNFYYEKIADATISLFADEQYVGSFEKGNYDVWELIYEPVTGQRYRLTVEVPGFPLIEATTTMPYNVPVVKDSEKDYGDMEKDVFWRKNYVQNEYSVPYWIFIMSKMDESDYITSRDRLENSLGTNHPACDRFNLSGKSMSERVHNNDLTMEQHVYLRIHPEVGEEYSFCVEGVGNGSWIFFRASSEEYDKYLKTSFQKMLVYSSFDDPSQWFDESVVYSNITNGLCIFGAYSDVVFKYKEDLPWN